MNKNYKKYKNYIQDNIIECDITYRGGVLKIDVSKLFPYIDSNFAVMGASQNYLGGGIAGAITGGSHFSIDELTTEKDKKTFTELMEACKLFFYEINNGGGDDYMQENVTGADCKHGYEKNQKLPVSGY